MEKAYKYYAVRVHNMIIVRRTLVGLRKITSTLTKPGTSFALVQTTFTGGKVIGAVPYTVWLQHGGQTMSTYRKIERSLAISMQPFFLRNLLK